MKNFVNIKLTIPSDLENIFNVLDNQSVGLAIREAIRSAVRPARNHMKSLMKTELLRSRQSTGASERAVASKAGRSKKNPSVFYAIIGIDRKVMELHSHDVPEGQKTKKKIGRGKNKQVGRGLFALRGRRNKTGLGKTKQVFSRYRSGKRKSVFKRKPSKYWHLINNGFIHYKSGKKTVSYDFTGKTKLAMATLTQELFIKKLRELVVPVIIKEINRKLKRGSR